MMILDKYPLHFSNIHILNKYYYFLGSSPARNVTSVRLTGSSGAPPEFDVDLDAIAANMQSRGKIRKLIKWGKFVFFGVLCSLGQNLSL